MNALFNSTFAEVHDVYESTPVRIGFVYPTCGIEPPPITCNLRIIAPTGNNGGNSNNSNITSGMGSVAQNGGGILFLIAAAVVLLLLGAIFT